MLLTFAVQLVKPCSKAPVPTPPFSALHWLSITVAVKSHLSSYFVGVPRFREEKTNALVYCPVLWKDFSCFDGHFTPASSWRHLRISTIERGSWCKIRPHGFLNSWNEVVFYLPSIIKGNSAIAAGVSNMPRNQTRNMVDTQRHEISQGLLQSKELFKKCFLWRASDFTHFSQHRHALAIMISLIWACGIHYFIASLGTGSMTNSLFLFGEKSDQKTQSFNSALPHLGCFPFPFMA